MSKTSRNRYGQLFLSVFRLSACTFGGGFVIVPLMRKRFVEELGWIKEQEMLDIVAIAQSSPGAIAVNAAVLVGYRVAGVPGALLSVLGTVLPPLVIISVISLFYRAFRDNPVVGTVMSGMLCGVAAVVLDAALNMAKNVTASKKVLPFVLLLGAFVAIRYCGMNIAAVILIGAAAGALDTLIRARKERAKHGGTD